jgi:cobalt-zinc-cadmium resistance protein CzcA
VVLLNVPFALIGGVIALYLRHLYLTFQQRLVSSLFGVAVLNGVVLISYINRLVDKGHPVEQAVTEGSRPLLDQ